MRAKVYLLLLSIFFSLLLCETALQIRYRIQSGSWLWRGDAYKVGFTQPVNDRRQYTLRPSYIDDERGITINDWGFRGKVVDLGTDSVVIQLGDSVPFGAGVKDDETYPAHLDKLLQQKGYGVRILNAGVPSYNLRQSFDRLQYDVLEHYKHPLLITIQAANDISLLTHFRDSYTPDVTWADVRWKSTWSRQPAFMKLATIYYMSRVVALLKHSSVKEQHELFPVDQMIDNVEAVLNEGLRFCEERSIPVIIMPVDPFYYQADNTERNSQLSRWTSFRDHIEMWNKIVEQLNGILVKASNTYPNVYFFDTRKVMDEQDRDEMYIDFIHYSPKGNQVIALALYHFLLNNQLLPESN